MLDKLRRLEERVVRMESSGKTKEERLLQEKVAASKEPVKQDLRKEQEEAQLEDVCRVKAVLQEPRNMMCREWAVLAAQEEGVGDKAGGLYGQVWLTSSGEEWTAGRAEEEATLQVVRADGDGPAEGGAAGTARSR